jgi:sulfur carrier protein
MINLMVNGKPRELEEAVDLASYLNSFGLNLQHVAVGYNGDVVAKDQFDQVKLKEGDVLEIVRPVGGG